MASTANPKTAPVGSSGSSSDPKPSTSGAVTAAASTKTVVPVEVVSDFDSTITSLGSDVIEALIEWLGDAASASTKMRPQSGAGYKARNDSLIRDLRQHGKGKDQIEELLDTLVLEEGAADAIRKLAARGIPLVVVSGSLTALVRRVLEKAGVYQHVHLVANPSAYDESGFLAWAPLHGVATGCQRGCAILCKRRALREFEAAHGWDVRKRVYVGDGGNDVCPILGLAAPDVALAKTRTLFDACYQEKRACRKMRLIDRFAQVLEEV